MRRFEDRVAVVTGAAGGIGRALAEALAFKGCDVALVDVDEEGLAQTAHRVELASRKASQHVVDVSDKQAMAALPDAVLAQHEHVHILVNNAGVSVIAPFEEHSLEDFEWIVGINFWGVVYGCKFFLPHLKLADEAHIVNMSSMFGLIGLPTQSSYCSTKFAVRGLSESLWVELADTNVGVTCVHPGGVRTNIVRGGRANDPTLTDRMAEQFELRAMPPEQAADRIVQGVERNEQRVLVCREAYVTDWLKRLSPTLTQRLAAWGARRFEILG